MTCDEDIDIRLQDLLNREVDVHPKIEARRFPTPLRKASRGFHKDEASDRDDQPHVFRERDEFAGQNVARDRVTPPHERLEPGDSFVRERHDRLVNDTEFFALDCHAQVARERQPTCSLQMHVLIEECVTRTTEGLRVIHRRVGIAQHVFDALVTRLHEGDPDRRRVVHDARLEFHRPYERILYAFGEGLDLREMFASTHQNREFIAADASDEIVRVDRLAQPFGNGNEQLIADHMTQTIVDRLEFIEIDEEDGKQRFGRGARPHERRFELLGEKHSIRKTRQGIVRRLVA